MADDFDSYRFPHLDDTKFPDIDTVDVYEYENDFDYNRWEDNTKVRLCNVLWSSDYSNVVKFDDDEQRDAWFDSLDSFVVDLKTAFNVAPDNSTKIPVPYQVATRYNYLYVELPVMTSADAPIDYETDRRTKRFYYFVDDLVQLSPSTTRLLVTLDAWTTYINNVDIPYMMLERGHAPMIKTDVQTYLRNPLQNNSYLLAPDFDFSRGDDVVSHSEFYPVNEGDKYIVVACTMTWEQFKQVMNNLPTVVSNPTSPASFYNLDLRCGYQMGVSGYGWDVGGYSYDGIYVPNDTLMNTGENIPNGHMLFAVESTQAYLTMNFLAERVGYLFRAIDGCFVVDKNAIEITDTINVDGKYTIYHVTEVARRIIGHLDLDVSMFGYDERYRNIVKLYTSPYAMLEISDNDNLVMKAKIENVSTVDFRLATSLAFPYVMMQAYVTGVNGDGFTSYTWKQLNGNVHDGRLPNSDFAEYMWNWEIPTYQLFISAYDDAKATEYPKRQLDRFNAIMDYQKSMRSRNTDRENSVDSANTTQTMTNNSANTEQTNAGNQANALVGNAGSRTACNDANSSADMLANNDAAQFNNNKLRSDANADNVYTAAATNAENAATVVTGIANAVSSITMNVSNPIGGIGAAAGGVAAAGMSSVANAGKNIATAEAAMNANVTKLADATSNINNQTDISNANISSKTANNNSCISAIASRDAGVMNTNAANTANTKKNNAKLNRDLTWNNSTYTRDAYMENAKAELEQKRQGNLAKYAQDKVNYPVKRGDYTGNPMLDAFDRRGLQVRVRTQPSDCIAQTGDMFLRYGYALNRVWDVSETGLELMSHFTYWKCADIWINEGVGVNQRAMQDIQRVFLNGVTIWNEPTEVGKVSIYDNEPA